jgi:hypothetical protein
MHRTIAAVVIALALSPAWAAEASAKTAELGLVFAPSGVWSKIQKDDPELAIYRARDAPEQITLRIMRSTIRMEAKARRETVDALVEHRQAAERRNADGKVDFQPVKVSERSGLAIASYCGSDRTTGRPFATMVLASPDSTWTLFYETLESPATTFCSRGEKFFATVLEAKKEERK